MPTTEAVGWEEVLVPMRACPRGAVGCQLRLFRKLASGFVKCRLRNYIYFIARGRGPTYFLNHFFLVPGFRSSLGSFLRLGWIFFFLMDFTL